MRLFVALPRRLAPLLLHQRRVEESRHDSSDADADQDPVSRPVVRRVLLQERERRHDTARVAKADHPGRADTALHVALQVHQVPAHDTGASAQRPHRDEADARVFGREVLPAVDADQDGEPDDHQRVAEQNVWQPDARFVRQVRHDETQAEGSGKRRNRVQLRLDDRVMQGLHDRGQEVRQSVDGNDNG